MELAFVEATVEGRRTGALDIRLPSRRILSLPSQLGCPVACSFCVSRTSPLSRNLRETELLSLVDASLQAFPEDGRPIELSFTGEGEPLMNARVTRAVLEHAVARWPSIASYRLCMSGFGAPALLERLEPAVLPLRLQVSLHAARQDVRDRLIQRSVPLDVLEASLRRNAPFLETVELNVVLQAGINDSDADLAALAAWGDPTWPILLNPLLGDGRSIVSPQTDGFEHALQQAGRAVRRYGAVGQAISSGGFYPKLASRAEQSVALLGRI